MFAYVVGRFYDLAGLEANFFHNSVLEKTVVANTNHIDLPGVAEVFQLVEDIDGVLLEMLLLHIFGKDLEVINDDDSFVERFLLSWSDRVFFDGDVEEPIKLLLGLQVHTLLRFQLVIQILSQYLQFLKRVPL